LLCNCHTVFLRLSRVDSCIGNESATPRWTHGMNPSYERGAEANEGKEGRLAA
jgi:hypothetical protein